MRVTESTQPRVSAIITAYNCAHYLGDAIKSVLAQTYPISEIVVIDDGSTDDVPSALAPFASAGIRYVRQENQGPSSARNRGIRETSGDVVAFLDGDDMWAEDKTARQIAYMDAHPEVALVSGSWLRWKPASNEYTMGYRRGGARTNKRTQQDIMVRNVIGNPSMVLVKRQVVIEAGLFDPSLRWGEDWELWIRIAARAPVAFLRDSKPVVIYRMHPAGLTHEKRWEQFSRYIRISQRAISTSNPVWRRPILLARAWSSVELDRALYSLNHDFLRQQQLLHAWQTLLLYPFENTRKKVHVVLWATVGPTIYNRLKMSTLIKSWKQPQPEIQK